MYANIRNWIEKKTKLDKIKVSNSIPNSLWGFQSQSSSERTARFGKIFDTTSARESQPYLLALKRRWFQDFYWNTLVYLQGESGRPWNWQKRAIDRPFHALGLSTPKRRFRNFMFINKVSEFMLMDPELMLLFRYCYLRKKRITFLSGKLTCFDYKS